MIKIISRQLEFRYINLMALKLFLKSVIRVILPKSVQLSVFVSYLQLLWAFIVQRHSVQKKPDKSQLH